MTRPHENDDFKINEKLPYPGCKCPKCKNLRKMHRNHVYLRDHTPTMNSKPRDIKPGPKEHRKPDWDKQRNIAWAVFWITIAGTLLTVLILNIIGWTHG